MELVPLCSGVIIFNMINYASEIKQAINMQDVCETYGVNINRSGFCRCCFHSEKTASMKIYRDGYKCYGCGAAGSQIDFVMRYFNLDFSAACAKINTDFSLGLPIGEELSLRELRRAENAIKERKAKREAEKAKYKALVDDWYQWMECWDTLDGYLRDLAPTTPDEEINPLYARAAKNIAYAGYMLDEAEMRLRKHELERSGNN